MQSNTCNNANAVGYQTLTIPAQQWNMLGVNFQSLGGTAINVQDVIPNPVGQGLAGATAISSVDTADQLAFWEPGEGVGNYIYLYLNCNTATTGANAGRSKKWCVQTANARMSDACKAKYGSYNTASTRVIQPGEGFWYKRGEGTYSSPRTITMAGQVVVAQSGLSINIRGDNGWTMFNTGFTTAFEPNPDVVHNDPSLKVNWVERNCVGATAISSVDNADQLAFWDPGEGVGSYVYLYLNTNTATTGTNASRAGHWCVQTANARMSDAAKAKYGSYNTASTASIPAGQAVWYKSGVGSADRTISIPQPYTLD